MVLPQYTLKGSQSLFQQIYRFLVKTMLKIYCAQEEYPRKGPCIFLPQDRFFRNADLLLIITGPAPVFRVFCVVVLINSIWQCFLRIMVSWILKSKIQDTDKLYLAVISADYGILDSQIKDSGY